MFDKQAQRMRALNQTQALLQHGHTEPRNPIPIKHGPKDMFGTEFRVGQRVVRSVKIGNSNGLRICEVTHIAGSCVYLDGSQRPISKPERLFIYKPY